MRRPLAAFGHPVSVIDRQIYAAGFVCCERIAMWNSLKSVVLVTPTLTRTVRRPGQPSVKAITRW